MRAFATTVLSLCLAAGLATADSAGGPSSAQAAVPQFAEARDTYGAPTTTSAFGDGTFTSTGSFGSGGGSSFSKPITYSSGTRVLLTRWKMSFFMSSVPLLPGDTGLSDKFPIVHLNGWTDK